MYEITTYENGTVNVLKNKQPLLKRELSVTNTQIQFVTLGKNSDEPSLILVSEDYKDYQTFSFYTNEGKFAGSVLFDNSEYLKTLANKKVTVISEDSEEYERLMEEEMQKEVGFFTFMLRKNHFYVFLPNSYTRFFSDEEKLDDIENIKAVKENFFLYSYSGEHITSDTVKNKEEAEEYYNELFLISNDELVA